MEALLKRVGRKVNPSSVERKRIASLAQAITGSARDACKRIGLDAEVRLDGSVAKDTWVAGEADLDIFLRVSPDLSREQLERLGLKAGRLTLRGFTPKILERFAEHPYLEAHVDGVRVNIVPCYRVERGKWQSATDRTPFHTEYIRAHLDDHGRLGVRLLKRFMKGIGVYGSDIRVGGFSGMLCETITAHYGSFEKAIRDAASWRSGKAIDVEGYYAKRENETPDLFPEQLVVIDPVDEGRNLAASVTSDRLWEFVAASRAFLQRPRYEFFYPKSTASGLSQRVLGELSRRGELVVAVRFGRIDAVVDIAWSQLYRTERALAGALRQQGFGVARSASWTDERTVSLIMLELESSVLPRVKTHRGPEVSRREESQRFLKRHTEAPDTVAGPWIDQGRWMVVKSRTQTQVAPVVEGLLRGGPKMGVAKKAAAAMRTSCRIREGPGILRNGKVSRELLLFLDQFLRGTPQWLERERPK